MTRRARSLSIPLVCGLVLALGLTTVNFRVVSARTTSATVWLWDAVGIAVPEGIRTIPLRIHNLGFPAYAFISTRDGRVALIAHLDFYSPHSSGFFNVREATTSRPFLLNGMPAWRKADGAYVRFNVRLPKPKGCSIQEYALLVFARGDEQAARMATTFRPKRPYRCLTWVP